MALKVYLDDIREAPKGWVRTRTYKETIDYLQTGKVDELSLDHDLGFTDLDHTGYDVLVWIERQLHAGNKLVPQTIFVHTQNPVGRARMQQAIAAIFSAAQS